MKANLLILFAALTLASCAGVPRTYVDADRATYDAIAPEYSGYITDDESLSDGQKQIRIDTLESWDARISAAEAANAK